jgi:hypothetical protein
MIQVKTFIDTLGRRFDKNNQIINDWLFNNRQNIKKVIDIKPVPIVEQYESCIITYVYYECNEKTRL